MLTEDLVSAGVNPATLTTTVLEGSRTELLRWLSTTTDPANCAPSIVSIAAPPFKNTWDNGNAIKDPNASKSAPTIDHVFEKQWLLGFFEHIIDVNAPPLATLSQLYRAPKINCADLHNYAFGPRRTRNGMGDLFNEMPGGDANFLSLAGMARGLNADAKGKVANMIDLPSLFDNNLLPKNRVKPTDTFDSGYKKVTKALMDLQDAWIGFEALNRLDIDDIVKESFWRLWDNLRVLEQIAWAENPGKNFTLAEKFADYMKNLKTDINAQPTVKVPQLLRALDADLLILRPLAASPDEISKSDGVQAKLNTFKAFSISSGKWTVSDLRMQRLTGRVHMQSSSAPKRDKLGPDNGTTSFEHCLRLPAGSNHELCAGRDGRPCVLNVRLRRASGVHDRNKHDRGSGTASIDNHGRNEHDAGRNTTSVDIHERNKHDTGSNTTSLDNRFPLRLPAESNHDLRASWPGRACLFIVCLRDDKATHERRNRDHVDHGHGLSVGPHKHMCPRGPGSTCILVLRLRPGDGASVTAGVAFTTTAVTIAAGATVV